MDIKIGKNALSGRVRIISSKSDGHRALISAALADRDSLLLMDSWSEDLEATARCLESLGAEITKETVGILKSFIQRAYVGFYASRQGRVRFGCGPIRHPVLAARCHEEC